MKRAVIDVGSNSVRLMMWADGITLYKRISTTRLGEGIAFSRRLKEEAMKRSASAVEDFVRIAEGEGADINVFATAAVRSAVNGPDFCKRVERKCGRIVDVVSGEEEALLGLYGALGTDDGGIIDVGGASTEVCFREGGSVKSSLSLDVGAVRLFDLCGQDRDKLECAIAAQTERLNVKPGAGKVYAIGGTATTIAAVMLGMREYDSERIQGYTISLEALRVFADDVLSRSVEERKKLDGMDERRADIIAGGALLLARVVEKLHLTEISVSDKDNLEGYLALRGMQ